MVFGCEAGKRLSGCIFHLDSTKIDVEGEERCRFALQGEGGIFGDAKFAVARLERDLQIS